MTEEEEEEEESCILGVGFENATQFEMRKCFNIVDNPPTMDRWTQFISREDVRFFAIFQKRQNYVNQRFFKDQISTFRSIFCSLLVAFNFLQDSLRCPLITILQAEQIMTEFSIGIDFIQILQIS